MQDKYKEVTLKTEAHGDLVVRLVSDGEDSFIGKAVNWAGVVAFGKSEEEVLGKMPIALDVMNNFWLGRSARGHEQETKK